MISRRILDLIIPTVNDFAARTNGKINNNKSELTVRSHTSNGIVTVQIYLRGSGDDTKLEVTGINRNGRETKRTIFSLKDWDAKLFAESLELALTG